jgi:hypothetical protein
MPAEVYVSITGLRLASPWRLPRFWWLTLAAVRQARHAPGHLSTSYRQIGGYHHTLSVWTDEAAMRRYLVAGAHLKAMKAFRTLGSGRTLGFTAPRAPDWPEAHALWVERSRAV